MKKQRDCFVKNVAAQERNDRTMKITVCIGSSCHLKGSYNVIQAFQQMIEEGRLVEYAQYVNHYYGTPRDYVEKKMAEGKDVILEIEIQGARKIKEQYPDAVLRDATVCYGVRTPSGRQGNRDH